MPSHQDSTEHSRHLCDALFGAVRSTFAKAETHASANWCSYSIGNSARFCFIQHQSAKVRIFLKAKETDGSQLQSLLPASRSIELLQRKTLSSDWAAITAYFTDISREDQIDEILPVLVHLAHKTLNRSSAERAARAVWNSPSEIISPLANASFWESAQVTIAVNRYERNLRARKACIKEYGAVCSVCGFDFGKRYGSIGVGFIHVHHVTSLSSIGRKYRLDPLVDLRLVCPNCHEMLHRRDPPLAIEELKKSLLNYRSAEDEASKK